MKGYSAERLVARPPTLTVVRYAAALLAVVAAVFLAMWLQPALDAAVILLMAVVLAAWFSGLWPALAASILAALALDYFFTQPLYTLRMDAPHILRLLVFAVVASLFSNVSSRRRRAEQSLKEARDELDAKVRERTSDLRSAHGEAVAAQQRFRDLVNSIEGIVWEADARTFQFTFVSQQAERVLGYPVTQWLAQPTFWSDHIYADDRESAVNTCIDATRAKRDHDFEYRMVAADGRLVWLRDLVNVVVEGGEATTLRGVMFDITVRKQAETALREQADLLNLTHDTIFVRDMNDVIRYWNGGAEELYGWTSQEAVGRVSYELTQTIFPAPLERISGELFRTGRWEGELVHTKRDGSKVIVASRWSLQRDRDGQPVAILETNNDVTRRKRAEADLRESERRHRHIFQTTGVSIWEEDFSRVKAAIDDLKREGVDDFREYLRTAPDFLEEAISLVRIVDVNEATLKLFGASTKEELLISLHTVFTPETRDVFAGNIAKHSGAKSARVDVRAGRQGIFLTVEDAGVGFAMDHVEGKPGLGFVSMRERLRVLRGTVRVDSAPSRGTRISAWVPCSVLASVHGEAKSEVSTAPAPSQNVSPA